MSNKELIKELREWARGHKMRGAYGTAARMRKAADALEAQEWQPIDTAPKDGTVVFVWHVTTINPYASFNTAIKKGKFLPEIGEWQVENVGGNVPPVVTHFISLPPAPEEEEEISENR